MNMTPKSYLHDEEERQGLLLEGGTDLLYLAESQEAGNAGDEETAWAWLSLVELEPSTLMGIKRRSGAKFIRDKGLRTTKADAAFGPGWLDRD